MVPPVYKGGVFFSVFPLPLFYIFCVPTYVANGVWGLVLPKGFSGRFVTVYRLFFVRVSGQVIRRRGQFFLQVRHVRRHRARASSRRVLVSDERPLNFPRLTLLFRLRLSINVRRPIFFFVPY